MTYVPPPATPVPPAQPAKDSGCLKCGVIGCIVVFILGIGFVGVLSLVVFGAIKSSDPYKESLRRTQNDPRVIAVLGEPVEAGWIVTGHINWENGKGVCNIKYSVHGPNGRAQVHAVAEKEPGRPWQFTEITATPNRGAPIDVLNP